MMLAHSLWHFLCALFACWPYCTAQLDLNTKIDAERPMQHETNIKTDLKRSDSRIVKSGPNQYPLYITGLIPDIQKIVAGYLSCSWMASKRLLGHRFEVSGLRFSPDSNYLASGSKQLNVWGPLHAGGRNIPAREVLWSWIKQIIHIAYAPNGDYIATETSNGVDLSDLKTRKNIKSFPAAIAPQFSADSNTLVMGVANTAMLHTYTIDTQNVRAWYATRTQFPHHYVTNCALSSDNTYCAAVLQSNTGIADGKVILCKYPSGEPVATFDAGDAKHLLFSPDSNYLAFSSRKPNCIEIVNISDSFAVTILTETERPIETIAFVPNTRILTVSCWDGILHFFDIFTKEKLLNDEPEALPISGKEVAFSPNGRYMATTRKNFIQLWENQNHLLLEPIKQKKMTVRKSFLRLPEPCLVAELESYFPVPQIQHCIADYLDSWDLISNHKRELFADQLILSPFGNYIAAYSHEGHTLKLWSVEKQKYIVRITPPAQRTCIIGKKDDSFESDTEEEDRATSGKKNKIEKIIFSANEKQLAIKYEKNIDIYEIDTMALVRSIKNYDDKIVFSKNGKYLISWRNGYSGYSYSSTIHIWNTLDGRLERKIELPKSSIVTCSVLANEQLALCCQEDYKAYQLKIIDWTTEQVITSYYLDNEIEDYGCCFSSDGELLATLLRYKDKREERLAVLKIYDTKSGKQRKSIIIGYWNEKFQFSQEGNTLSFYNHETKSVDLYALADIKNKYAQNVLQQQFNIKKLTGNRKLGDILLSQNSVYLVAASKLYDCGSSDDESDADEEAATSVMVHRNLGLLIKQACERKENK